MIRNYFKIAWRNISKHGFYSGINILGLFTGLLFALLIGAYIWEELQVNNRLKNADQHVILMSDWKDPNMGVDFTSLGPLAKRLKEDYPSLVENYFRWDGITSIVSKGDKSFREGLLLGDSTLYTMYGFELLYGNKKTILKEPFSVVLTADKALKYFGTTDVIGETINIQNFSGDKHEFVIDGIFESISKNSVTQINNNNNNGIFIPSNTLKYFNRGGFEDWKNIYIPSYIQLKKGVSLKDLEQPIQTLIDQNASERIKLNLKVNPVYLKDFYLQKDNALVQRMIYTLSFIGLFILVMAIINFINISISAASSRMKEIGVRKVMGGLRIQLIFQFLIESFILVFSAMVLALITYSVLSPLFNDLLDAKIPSIFLFPPEFIFVIAGLTFVVSLLSGLYPAFVLSNLKPVDSIKGKLSIKKENIFLRKSLVGFQFTIALIVLISATIVTQQVDYFFGKELGYNKESVLLAQVPRDWTDKGVRKMETIRNEFETLPEIIKASLSFEIPNGNNGLLRSIRKVGAESSDSISMKSLSVDSKFLETYEVALKSGSYLFNDLDSTGVVINAQAALKLGWDDPKGAIGQQIKGRDGGMVFTIRGVTDDFHFGSMHEQVQPIIMFNLRINNIFRYMSFKIHSDNIKATIAAIEKKWAELLPGGPFEYTFMDENLEQLYTSEIQLKKAAYNASLLSLIIVLLGVIGLVSLSIQNRTKEIGIRKVLGASSPNIIQLFLKEFLFVILIACAIAVPLSYFIMQNWLNNYVYHIDISMAPFAYSIGALIVITTLLIGLLTWRTANRNPTKNLRTE